MSSLASAEKALEKARASHGKWQEQLRAKKESQASVAAMTDDTIGTVSLEKADAVFAEHDRVEQALLGVIEKVERRVAKEAEKVAAAERRVIEAHAEEEQKLANAARSKWHQHRDERDKLKAALEAHDGVTYKVEPVRLSMELAGVRTGEPPARTTETDRMRQAYISAKVRVATVRHFLATGELANVATVKDEDVTVSKGTPTGLRQRELRPEERPEVIYGPQPEEQRHQITEASMAETVNAFQREEGRTWTGKQLGGGPAKEIARRSNVP